MRYEQFHDSVRGYLWKQPEGATWAQLRQELKLAYRTACYSGIHRMEDEIGLHRARSREGVVWTTARRTRRGLGA